MFEYSPIAGQHRLQRLARALTGQSDLSLNFVSSSDLEPNCLGETIFDPSTRKSFIRLRGDLPEEQLLAVYLHECGHAARKFWQKSFVGNAQHERDAATWAKTAGGCTSHINASLALADLERQAGLSPYPVY